MDDESEEEETAVDVFAFLHPVLDIVLLVELLHFILIETTVQFVTLVMVGHLLTTCKVHEVQQCFGYHHPFVFGLFVAVRFPLVPTVLVVLLPLVESLQ